MRSHKVLWITAGLAALVLGFGFSALAPYHQPPEEEKSEQAEVITIRLGNFFFEGPAGKSDSTEEPQVVARLKHGQAYKLQFVNTTSTPHQVISPLFSAPEEKVFSVAPNSTVEIEITPNFLTVEDGFPLQFELACHVGHGSGFDHFKQGMHALIEVVPPSP